MLTITSKTEATMKGIKRDTVFVGVEPSARAQREKQTATRIIKSKKKGTLTKSGEQGRSADARLYPQEKDPRLKKNGDDTNASFKSGLEATKIRGRMEVSRKKGSHERSSPHGSVGTRNYRAIISPIVREERTRTRYHMEAKF